MKNCAEFVYGFQVWIYKYEKQLEKMKNIIPFDQLTNDDLNEVFSESKIYKK
jgi:F-type H+-transporting ATPase subunit d